MTLLIFRLVLRGYVPICDFLMTKTLASRHWQFDTCKLLVFSISLNFFFNAKRLKFEVFPWRNICEAESFYFLHLPF